MIGRQLGSFTIQSLLGAGGMGEVYRARDSKLERDVAIKVLPATLLIDTERRARFEREARLLASLNHPNIAQIYGVEESAGVTALVLELVDGESLAIALDLRCICVSTGSACMTGAAKPSHVLQAMGVSERYLRGSIRFSFGRENVTTDAAAIADAVIAEVSRLRTLSPVRV